MKQFKHGATQAIRQWLRETGRHGVLTPEVNKKPRRAKATQKARPRHGMESVQYHMDGTKTIVA